MSKDPNLEKRRSADGRFGSGRTAADAGAAADRAASLDEPVAEGSQSQAERLAELHLDADDVRGLVANRYEIPGDAIHVAGVESKIENLSETTGVAHPGPSTLVQIGGKSYGLDPDGALWESDFTTPIVTPARRIESLERATDGTVTAQRESWFKSRRNRRRLAKQYTNR